MQTLWQDLRYGVRMLVKQSGFAVIAVVIAAANQFAGCAAADLSGQDAGRLLARCAAT